MISLAHELFMSEHYPVTLSWYKPWYCGSVGNKIDPCGSHAGNFLVMLDEFYLGDLTYSALENA